MISKEAYLLKCSTVKELYFLSLIYFITDKQGYTYTMGSKPFPALNWAVDYAYNKLNL